MNKKSENVIISKQNATPVVEKLRTGTFVRQADWATSKTKESIEENWEHAAANPAPFGNRLETAAAETIKKKIFSNLCPNYIDDPTTAIIKIKQVYKDPVDSSKTITSTVSEYHSKLLQLMEQKGTKDKFTMDVVQHFYQNLAPKIKDKVKVNGYKGDTIVNSRKPYEQFNALNELFERATNTEY